MDNQGTPRLTPYKWCLIIQLFVMIVPLKPDIVRRHAKDSRRYNREMSAGHPVIACPTDIG